jgi:hypothetical protein
MPRAIDGEMLKFLENIREEELSATLGGKLTPAQIDAVCARLRVLKDALRDGKFSIVDGVEWGNDEKLRTEAAITDRNSYFRCHSRESAALDRDPKMGLFRDGGDLRGEW